jgi:DNA-binding XRE family transcriptional regulator
MKGEDMDNLSSWQACEFQPFRLDIMSVEVQASTQDNMSMRTAPPKAAVTAKNPNVSRFYADFAARLVNFRETMGYTQEVFADLLELPRASYIKYESRSKFPLHAVPRLANLTKESIDSIVTGRNIKMFRARIVK